MADRNRHAPGADAEQDCIVISNVFADDNKGGALITQQTIRWMKRFYPTSTIYIVPVEPDGVYDGREHRFTLREFPDVRVLRSPLRSDGSFLQTFLMLCKSLLYLLKGPNSEFARVISQARLVVGKGGHVFVERRNWGRLIGLWVTAYPLVYAARRGIRTLVLCGSVGPFRSTSSRILNGWILRRISLVVTRDPISTEQARSLGCRNVLEFPDIVFTYDPAAATTSTGHAPSGNDLRLAIAGAGQNGTANGQGGLRYAVVVISGKDNDSGRTFQKNMGALLKRLLDERLVDRCVVVLQSLQDRSVSQRFVENQRDDRVIFLNRDLSPEELIRLYRDAECVIAKRLHAGIFSLLARTPVFLFQHDGTKMKGVMDQLGVPHLYPYPNFPVDQLFADIAQTVTGSSAPNFASIESAAVSGRASMERLRSLLSQPESAV